MKNYWQITSEPISILNYQKICRYIRTVNIVFLFRSKEEEILQLKDALNAIKFGHKTYDSRLTVTDVQITQLEKQILDLTTAKNNVNK